jgi:hypothetical protein
MKLLADQDVYAGTVAFLRGLGHDVDTAAERGVPCPRLCVGMPEQLQRLTMPTQSGGHGTPHLASHPGGFWVGGVTFVHGRLSLREKVLFHGAIGDNL